MVNNEEPWVRGRKEHQRHHKNGGHIRSMAFALNSDYFNDMGIDGQLEVAITMFKTNTPENRFKTILFCCHRTGGFVGNTGHNWKRLDYYLDIIYYKCCSNAKRKLRINRPWSGGV